MPKAIVTVALIKKDKTWDKERVESDGANLYNVFQNAEAEVRMKLGDLPDGVVAITAICAEWVDAEKPEETEWEWRNGELRDLPEEMAAFRTQHYQEVFKGWRERVTSATTKVGTGILLLRERVKGRHGSIVAGCVIESADYFLRFRDFVVLPGNRGKGYARKLMEMLADAAKRHHETLLANKDKPDDINMMYLRSLIYFDADEKGPEFEFGKFLKKMGFTAQKYNKHQLTPLEVEALEAYEALYPEHVKNIRVFVKLAVDNGVKLKPECQKELLLLNAEQHKTALEAVNMKLDNYEKSGRVSYRYDVCPICKSMSSSEQNSDNCKKCYIHKTCLEPFRKQGRFKEDFLIGAAYFNEMRCFLSHPT